MTPISPVASSLMEVFQSIEADSCPSRYNFHLHTHCSDGQLQPEELMEQAVAVGLEDLAITDHHSIEGYKVAQHWLAAQPTEQKLPTLWIGAEITALLAQTDVHILAYDFDADAPALQTYLQGHRIEEDHISDARCVIDAIHAAQGLAVLAHPARYKRSPETLVAAAADLGIDGLETYYCYKSSDPWRPSPGSTDLMQQLTERYRLLRTCGTDTHGVDICQRR
ncbi:MAG: PHP domain-containing protein [Thermosynechococcaceae cyanobacterium]